HSVQQFGKSLDHERSPRKRRGMNVARRTAFLLDSFVFEFNYLGVLDVVGDVSVAIVRARIDIQQLFRCRGAGKIGEEFVRASQPRTHTQITADIRERVLERISIPETDAVTILQMCNSFGRERVEVSSK